MSNDWVEAGAGSTEAWDGSKPIEGVYVAHKTEVGPNKSNMYVLKTKTGQEGIWGSTVIDSKFSEIPLGSEVRIEFKGMAKGKSGKEYKDYLVQYRPAPFQEAGVLPAAPASTQPSTGVSIDDDQPPVDLYEL